MATVQINAELTPDDVLEAVKQFSSSELESFTERVYLIQAQRKTPHASRRETELLKFISEGLPEEVARPYTELRSKMEAETITKAEHAELLRLVDDVEQYTVERLQWLIELAQIRQTTLPELIDELGLQPRDA